MGMPKSICKNLEKPSKLNLELQNLFSSEQWILRLKKQWKALTFLEEIEVFQKKDCNHQSHKELCKKAPGMKNFQDSLGLLDSWIMVHNQPQFWNRTSQKEDRKQLVGLAQFITLIKTLKVLLKESVSVHIKLAMLQCYRLAKCPSNSMSNSKILAASRRSRVTCPRTSIKVWAT